MRIILTTIAFVMLATPSWGVTGSPVSGNEEERLATCELASALRSLAIKFKLHETFEKKAKTIGAISGLVISPKLIYRMKSQSEDQNLTLERYIKNLLDDPEWSLEKSTEYFQLEGIQKNIFESVYEEMNLYGMIGVLYENCDQMIIEN